MGLKEFYWDTVQLCSKARAFLSSENKQVLLCMGRTYSVISPYVLDYGRTDQVNLKMHIGEGVRKIENGKWEKCKHRGVNTHHSCVEGSTEIWIKTDAFSLHPSKSHAIWRKLDSYTMKCMMTASWLPLTIITNLVSTGSCIQARYKETDALSVIQLLPQPHVWCQNQQISDISLLLSPKD